MIKVKVKPLSVNEAYTGKRYKTDKYKAYITELLWTLPKIKMPKPPYKVYFEFGFSNKGADWDGPIKNFQDVLQERYKFNDKEVYEGHVIKKVVPKGHEYIIFNIEHLEESY